MLAHVGGVPVEETVMLWLSGGASAGVLLAYARQRLRRRDRP